MADVIHLLPDNVANQIAAGEVIQRPASVVKELLENAIDAGSSKIQLAIKDAGKTLIQVTDNGCGMSDTDARMSFERHATSKIQSADELFNLTTKGFRGEALASIASIAHVSLKSKREENELGTQIEIEGSIFKSQEPVSTPTGTTFAIKNLFFNVPARRNFLKSDQVETKHIIDEFLRVAIPHADIEFSLHHNNEEIYFLPKGNLKQRIVSIYGKRYEERLVPINEETTIVQLTGYVGKPEFAKKTRGEQFFFVNGRFIKSPYLNHAINNAYEELIAKDQFPSYYIFFDVDPKTIDVNIHPTKTEIKFEEERSIYAILQSAVRSSLGKFNIAPTLDFEQESSFNQFLDPNREVKVPEIQVDPNYNPFEGGEKKSNGAGTGSSPYKKESVSPEQWEPLYDVTKTEQTVLTDEQEVRQDLYLQLNEKYLVGSTGDGYVLVDQYRAHYRILYDRFIEQIEGNPGASQGLIFAETVEVDGADFKLINAIEGELQQIGFQFTKDGHSLVIESKPADLVDCDTASLIQDLLEAFKMDVQGNTKSPKESIARSMASAGAIKRGRKLNPHEIRNLMNELMASSNPGFAPNGKPVTITVKFDEIEKQFG